mgnify:CR=1 FL=1
MTTGGAIILVIAGSSRGQQRTRPKKEDTSEAEVGLFQSIGEPIRSEDGLHTLAAYCGCDGGLFRKGD